MKVLGVDLACSWANLGSAELEFDGGQWITCQSGVMRWPTGPCDAVALARLIDEAAAAAGVFAVSMDGPQGWRDPQTARAYVGRQCELDVQAQGKTGLYGKTYPQNQSRWISLCIETFALLLDTGRAVLANDPSVTTLPPLPTGQYYLLECFPTSSWRTSGLTPLGGHRTPADEVNAFAEILRVWFGLPALNWTGSHDDLQAIVAALPAAALAGGPCVAVPRGLAAAIVPASATTVSYRIEGIIWDVRTKFPPPAGALTRPARPDAATAGTASAGSSVAVLEKADEAKIAIANPTLPDFRDATSDEVIGRGVKLFDRLVAEARNGRSAGVGYACFVKIVHGVARYEDVTGRPFQNATDIRYVLQLARLVTEEAGGRQSITRNGASINAGMDTFIWPQARPHNRHRNAFKPGPFQTPYDEVAWRATFPDGTRFLIPECR